MRIRVHPIAPGRSGSLRHVRRAAVAVIHPSGPQGRAAGTATGVQTKGHAGIAGPWLDAYVTEAVLAAVDTGSLVDAIKARRKPKKSRKASEVEARIELLDTMMADGKITQARFERMNATLVDQLAAAQATERSTGVDIPVDLARNLSERWDDLPMMTRRQIVAAVLERIEVSKADGRGPVTPERVTLTWRA